MNFLKVVDNHILDKYGASWEFYKNLKTCILKTRHHVCGIELYNLVLEHVLDF